MTIWAAILNQVEYGGADNILLQIINAIIILIVLWVSVEGVVEFFRSGSRNTIAAEEGGQV